MFKDYLAKYRNEITEGDPNNGICFDGVVSRDHYFAKDKKLMFLLKETNGNDSNGNEREKQTDWEEYMDWVYAQSEDKPLYRSVFRNIAMWARMFDIYTVEKRDPNVEELVDNNGLIIDKTLRNALKGISIVNLKKSWGVASTDWSKMKEYLENDCRREIVKYQVNTLNPSIVLCGGTFDFAQDIFECVEEKAIDGIKYFVKDDTIFVKCYHPSRPGWSRIKSFEHMDNIFKKFLV